MKIIFFLIKTIFVPLIDAIDKFGDLFNLKFYSQNKRISNVLDGYKTHTTEDLAIFVVYQKNHIPFYIKNVLQVLDSLKVNVLVTVNQEIGSEQISWLRNETSKVIVRKNFGRDFAAYKDAINIANLSEYQKLIILNDSVVYFSKNLKDVFETMLSKDKDIVCLTENYEKAWHVQSYFYSLSKKIFDSNQFKEFWKNYKPFNSRPHSVFNGEIAFSQKVLSKYSSNRYVYYSVSRLASLASIENQNNNLFIKKYFDLVPINQLQDNIDSIFLNHEEDKEKEKMIRAKVLEESFSSLEKLNPSHYFAFLAPYLTNTCILKKDLVFRGTYSIIKTKNALKLLGLEDSDIEEVINEMILKGSIKNLSLLNKLKAMVGLI